MLYYSFFYKLTKVIFWKQDASGQSMNIDLIIKIDGFLFMADAILQTVQNFLIFNIVILFYVQTENYEDSWH